MHSRPYLRIEIPNHSLQPSPLAAMGTQDGRQIVDSARPLRALDRTVLLVGHGPAVASRDRVMATAVNRPRGR
jgi:hypothetical protein